MSDERPPAARNATPRTAVELPVSIQVAGWPEPRGGLTANVSATGMFVRFERPEPIGTMVRLELDLGADSEPVRGMGEVIWIRVRWEGKNRPAGMGIRFLGLAPEPAAALEKKLDELQAAEEAGADPGTSPRSRTPLIAPLRPPAPAAAPARPTAPRRRALTIVLLLIALALLALALFLQLG